MGIRRIAIVLFFLSCIQLQAQSYKTIEKGGEKYYVHTVEKGNTLYSISKLYGVDLAFIEEANDNLADGLSIGEQILIPLKFRDRKFNKKPKPIFKDDHIVHTVFKKETIYSISRHYSISENDLLDANPKAKDGLYRGQQLIIPISSINAKKEEHLEPALKSNFLQHKVEKGQTLYAISKEYEVPIDDILKANPGLSQSLNEGMLINIPILNSGDNGTDALDPMDSLNIDFDLVPVKNIALLLPFEFKDLDSLSASDSKKRNAFALIDLAIEFYRGAKIACEKYSRQGGNVNLMVFNMKNDPDAVNKCVEEGWLDECDVVIGPFHKNTFAQLSNRFKDEDKILVSPNLRTTSILRAPNVFKVNPDKGNEIDFLAKQIATKHFGHNILLLESDIKRDQSLIKAMQLKLNRYLHEQEDRLNDSVKLVNADEVSVKGRKVLSISEFMLEDTTNVVVVPSNNLSFVSDVLTKLNRKELDELEIQVYGFESWTKFDNIDINYKQKFNLTLSASKNLDYDDESIRQFMREYYDSYETIPSDKGYAFLSYDVSNFLLKSMDDYGNKAHKHLDKVKAESIYQNIVVSSTKDESWTNTGFFLLQHKDFKLVKSESDE